MIRRLADRPTADRDVEEQAEFYGEDGGEELVVRFLLAVDDAYNFIRENPRSGAPHQVRNPRLQGLRSWAVSGFEDVRVYYLQPEETLVRVVRVLHGKRDVEAILRHEHR